MKHKLTRETYQWSKVRGGRPEDAMTTYVCEVCKGVFVHRYNREPDIYKAAADQGFDLDSCPGALSDDDVESISRDNQGSI